MPQPTAAEIEKHCDDWCAVSTTQGGELEIGASTEKFRLLAIGVAFHGLSHEQLFAALIGLSNVLFRPGFHTILHCENGVSTRRAQ